MNSNHPAHSPNRLWDVVKNYWDLGFTAFGGPPTHFQILHRRFVEKTKWITEEQYKELFALTQALSGPASTKMGFCIALEHSGFIGACVAFLLWSLPGAAGMFGFAQGVASIGDTLPTLVYALLSGLNASTVGIVAVAAFQLSERSITDPLSRVIILFTGGAGMLYKALWYFPLLMVVSGIATCWWDVWGGHELAKRAEKRWTRTKGAFSGVVDRPRTSRPEHSGDQPSGHDVELSEIQKESPGDASVAYSLPAVPEAAATSSVVQRSVQGPRSSSHSIPLSTPPRTPPAAISDLPPQRPLSVPLTVKTGLWILIAFFASFIALLVLRGALHHAPLLLKLYTNMYLAGTIIFGGGPVVIPLLREYVVSEGWVSSRDFLLGLAVIQSFPGPNFNFAVYLAALAAKGAGIPSIAGAILGWIGIFLPGLALATAASSLFPLIRKYKFVPSLLRGVNAGAIGLVWTAVYRLWEIGYLTPRATSGTSLGLDPWWVVVALVAFSGNRWFKVPAPVSILVGGVMGIAWWGVIGRRGTAVFATT
ncbi:hypothetical protein FS837_006689 [Tulasnella sp. UAMH 9824]|nr:hypothetical protein FS837_006689 [Tulasnella sp. UAMH 9824]